MVCDIFSHRGVWLQKLPDLSDVAVPGRMNTSLSAYSTRTPYAVRWATHGGAISSLRALEEMPWFTSLLAVAFCSWCKSDGGLGSRPNILK
jgi:hypothetical protein